MPGVSSVLVILCACLSLIEATTMNYFNFSVAILLSCGLSKLSDFYLLACFKKAAWMSDAWGFQRLGDIMRLSFLSLKRLPFQNCHLSSSMKLHIQLLQERCVNARCLGFPTSLWRYTHFLSTIEAGIIMTCRILRHGSCRSRIYWSTSDNLIFQKLQFFSHSTVEPLFRAQFAYVWFCLR